MKEHFETGADRRITEALAAVKGTLPWRTRHFERGLKRLLDVCVAAPLLVLLSPVLMVTALLVRGTSRGPVLLRQARLGLEGVPFSMYKFRTMVATLPDGTTDGEAVVTDKDARLTPVGGVLRAWRLDELPQLWHVLTGEMSLVGPRPELPANLELYAPAQMARFAMPQGCCTLAFVRGAFGNDWSERQNINVAYVRDWSFALDVEIIVKSAIVLLRQKDVTPSRPAASNVTMEKESAL